MNSSDYCKSRRIPLAGGLLLLAGLRLVLAAPDQPGRIPMTAAADEFDASRSARIDAGFALDAREIEPPAAPTVRVEGGYTAEVLGVVAGGLRRGAVHRGLADAALQCNLTAITGAPVDTVFRLSALFPDGGNFSGARLGDLQGASNIEAYNHPLLYELWLGGKLAGDRLAWRAGRLLADGDFATTESGAVFLNSSFGWPAFISANTRNTGPAFYRSALGAFARLALTEKFHAQAGLYDGDSFDDPGGDPSRHPNGLHFELGHGQGRFAVAAVRISSDYRRAERAAGAELLSDYERVVELSYRFVARESWHFMPNLQWIQHPGGSRALHDALVLGLRTRFTY